MTHKCELEEFYASVLCAPVEASHCWQMSVHSLVEYGIRRKCGSWIPQWCLCVSVGFNEGFLSPAVSRRPTETQPLTITGCCIAAWTEAAPEHATV